MKRLSCVMALALAGFFLVSPARATLLVGIDSTYSDGNLVGQNGWTQLLTVASNPLTLSSGTLNMINTGQDAYRDLGTTISNANLYFAATLSLSAAQTGDFFLGFATAANTSSSGARLYAKSSGAGFVLGFAAGSTVTYSATVLNFNQSYRFVVDYATITGSGNDIGKVYVNPTDTTVEANNTAYLTTVAATGIDTAAFLTLNQGTSTAAATLTMSNLAVGTTFADVAGIVAVPEPSTEALLFLALLGFLGVRAIRARQGRPATAV